MQMGHFLAIATLTALATGAASPALAEGEAAAGETVFKRRCAACHTLETGKNRVGPSLHGVVDRPAGTAEGYRYSDSYIAAGEQGFVWTQEKMIEYLADPRIFMREITGDAAARSKMTFKLRDLEDRENVAAFLATVK